MTTSSDGPIETAWLHATEGMVHLGGAHALLKGLFESEIPAHVFTIPAGTAWSAVARAARQPAVIECAAQHGVELMPVPHDARGVTVAARRMQGGGVGVALISATHLLAARPSFADPADGGALALVVLDDPTERPVLPPTQWAQQLGLTTLVAEDLNGAREQLEWTLQLSRLTRQPAVLVIHPTLLRTTDVVDARPNRVTVTADATVRRRQLRRPRPLSGDSESVLRSVRRAERNRLRSLPSPGERVPVGFITVGPCGPALRHAVHAAGLTGRVPHLALNVLDPLDPAVVQRVLGRCDDIVVLEPRPGEVGARILHQAMALRRGASGGAGVVWTTALPGVTDDDEPSAIDADEMTRPSAVMRRVHHLFARIRTVRDLPVAITTSGGPTLPRGAAFGAQAMLDSLDGVVEAVGVWLDERGQEVSGDETPPPILSPDGRAVPGAGTRRVVPLERWTADAFRRRGISAVRQTARAKRPWILIVADDGHDDAIDPLRLARAAVPAAGAASARIEESSVSDHERLIEFIRTAALGEGLFVLIVRDEPPHFMPARLDARQEEIDRLGFTPRQRLISDVERDCAIRPPNPVVAIPTDTDELQTAVRIDRLSRRLARRPIFRIRPMLEQVEIVRTRPPAGRGSRDDRLPLPDVLHGRASSWRVHCAGYRGDGPGVLADVLIRAGRQMGYVVRTIHDATPIGPGRRSWAQILFTQPARSDKPIELSARAGAGEIDLVLGLDPAESVRALTDDPELRVADASTTFGVLNAGAFTDQTEDDVAVVVERLERDAHAHLRRDHFVLRDLAGACRAWFHSDRLTDLALLGLAFQEGLIPVTLDAVESAVRAEEANGIGRAHEAFHFGRRYASEAPRLRPSEDEAADRLCRRLIHRARLRHERDAEEFATLLTESVAAMPGLRETDRGRHALHDFVVGLDHCRLWGGTETASALAQRVTALYRHDRGSAGRDLTCSAILPLASAMVLRDAISLAAIVTGAEHRRRQRRRLDVKGGREDRIERRFLTRIELIIATWRFRLDLRSSDWAPRTVNRLRPLIRRRMRGSKRERELRDAVVELVEHATHADGAEYSRLQHALHELHLAAARTQLRAMNADDVRALWQTPVPSIDDETPNDAS